MARPFTRSKPADQKNPESGLIIEWLRSAALNRFHQLDDIAQDNPLAAADQDEEIERQVNMLLHQPKLGRPGRVRGTRELVIGRTPFIVIYRLLGTARIEVLCLLHSAQQWPPV